MRLVEHLGLRYGAVDLRLDPNGDVILSWTEAPGARNKLLRRDEIARLQRLADAVSLAEASRQSSAIDSTRTALSAALFELLDGPERDTSVMRSPRSSVPSPWRAATCR